MPIEVTIAAKELVARAVQNVFSILKSYLKRCPLPFPFPPLSLAPSLSTQR
tara:strand:+ start:244 stop:396 length:153 start_codon:yes stop_codon:yes gene_type:complete